MASIRALLTGDTAEYTRTGETLDRTGRQARGALLSAAFFTAADRRFSKTGTPADVVTFVGNLRARHGLTEELDPRTAERLLLATFTDEEIDDIGPRVRGEHFTILLVGLIMDEQLPDAELDAFLDEARVLADQWLAD
ncbi:MAG: hypothetical protein GEV11_01795 [Streptosporangiales bacterium]|nr:hypothetical protein [Streptosporangiales bacterium]